MKKTLTSIFLACLLLAVAANAGAQDSTVPKWKIADLERYMDTSSTPTVINFWATFCVPCIKELPYFQELARKYESRGVRLLLVSLDLPEDYKKVAPFAARRKISAPVVFLDETNADLFCPKVDKSWSGALPATLFLNKRTGYRSFVEDSFTREKLEAAIVKMLP